jgi:hypothetical protein
VKHRKPAITKTAIARYARHCGLTYAQTNLYGNMLLHDERFVFDTAAERYYHSDSRGNINRKWTLPSVTAQGLITADLVSSTSRATIIYYRLRPDAKPTP